MYIDLSKYDAAFLVTLPLSTGLGLKPVNEIGMCDKIWNHPQLNSILCPVEEDIFLGYFALVEMRPNFLNLISWIGLELKEEILKSLFMLLESKVPGFSWWPIKPYVGHRADFLCKRATRLTQVSVF